MAMILQEECEDVTEEMTAQAEKYTVQSLLDKHDILKKAGVVSAFEFQRMFTVLVNGAKANLDQIVTQYDKVVVLPRLVGG